MPEVILEQGINANGDLCIAKKLIDIAHTANIPYVKFQKRTIDLVYSEDELEKPRESRWGTTTRQQKEGLEFNKLDYIELSFYCQQKDVKWFASPWDTVSLDMLAEFQIPFIKIPSALITNKELLEACKQYTIPVILSSGMSTLEMVDEAVDVLGKDRIYCIMHCTSTYPTKPEESNIKCIGTMKERYPWTKIGFSNHYPGLMSLTMAYVLGAEMLEFHGTLDRTMEGSDQASSIEPKGIFELMERIKLIDKMQGDGVKKIFESEKPIIQKLRR